MSHVRRVPSIGECTCFALLSIRDIACAKIVADANDKEDIQNDGNNDHDGNGDSFGLEIVVADLVHCLSKLCVGQVLAIAVVHGIYSVAEPAYVDQEA